VPGEGQILRASILLHRVMMTCVGYDSSPYAET
jgi:hypothetical protein